MNNLPNENWFDVIKLLMSIDKPRRLWECYYDGSQDKHGHPIIRTEYLWYAEPRQLLDGDWYVAASPNKSDVDNWRDTYANPQYVYKLGDFPWRRRHGLFESKRKALKALHVYEQALIDCNFDKSAADKVYDGWRFGAKSAQEARVDSTTKQVDGFNTNAPAEGKFDGNKGE